MSNKTYKYFLTVLSDETRKSDIGRTLYSHSSYYMSVSDNIYTNEMIPEHKEMFLNGSGNELTGKACAIHSSSMFAYNFYHWISKATPLTIGNHSFTKVYFEVQLPTLIGSTPANMDVVLEEVKDNGERTLLFIESKFTEHFKNANSEMIRMSNSSYSVKKKRNYPYYPFNEKRFSIWQNIITSFAQESLLNSGYYDGIKQEICHLIALSNLKNDPVARAAYNQLYEGKSVLHPEITGNEEFMFFNILFDASEKFKEHDKYNDYKELYIKLQERIKELDLGFSHEIKSYKLIFDAIPESGTDNLKEYLNKRYMQFAK